MVNRFAEIACPVCEIVYKIKLEAKEYIPDERYLFCPICGCKDCKASWIDGNGT